MVNAMSPERELILACALTAVGLATIAYVAIGALSGAPWSEWPSNARSALGIAPAAALTAALAAWLVAGWRESVDLDRKWTALGMAVKTVGLAFLMFPVFVLLLLIVAELLDQAFAAGPGTFREAWVWMPAIAVYALIFGLMFGALPALAAATLFCRRYLRLTANGHKTQ
jgi:hypothetical protein